MSIISEISLESNKKIHVNFDGGNLTSDGGLLLMMDFISKLGVDRFNMSFSRRCTISDSYSQ